MKRGDYKTKKSNVIKLNAFYDKVKKNKIKDIQDGKRNLQ